MSWIEQLHKQFQNLNKNVKYLTFLFFTVCYDLTSFVNRTSIFNFANRNSKMSKKRLPTLSQLVEKNGKLLGYEFIGKVNFWMRKVNL